MYTCICIFYYYKIRAKTILRNIHLICMYQIYIYVHMWKVELNGTFAYVYILYVNTYVCTYVDLLVVRLYTVFKVFNIIGAAKIAL